MAHAKQQVRSAAATLLDAATPDLGIIWQHRDPPDRGIGNYVLVYVDSEDIEAMGIEPDHLQARNMFLAVRGRLRDWQGQANEDRAHAFAEQVEKTLTQAALNAALSNKLKILQLESTSVQEIEEENERTFLEVALDFRVQVHTLQSSPQTLI